MALACGCAVKPGVPLGKKELKAHYKHTLEAMLFWEFMRRESTPQDDRNHNLALARIAFIEALEALYPEAKDEP